MKGTMAGESTGPGTTVGVNVALTGTLKDQNDITIYGMVDGEVICERSVVIGETAQVKGPIRGQIITISGTVRGSIEALEKLEILETGKVLGSITTKDLVIHSGAKFVGKSEMSIEEGDIPEESEQSEEDKEAGQDDQVAEEETDQDNDEQPSNITEQELPQPDLE